MPRKIALYAFALTLLGGSVATVADALVLTDEEQLDALVEDLTSSRVGHRVDAVLDFAAPSREPVEVVADGEADSFADGDEVELAGRTRALLADLETDDLDVVQHTVDIEGERARIVVRVRTADGYLNAQLRLHRHEDRWLIESLRVT